MGGGGSACAVVILFTEQNHLRVNYQIISWYDTITTVIVLSDKNKLPDLIKQSIAQQF